MSFLFIMAALLMGSNSWAQMGIVNINLDAQATNSQPEVKKKPVQVASEKPFKKECHSDVADLEKWAKEDYPSNMPLFGSEFASSKNHEYRLELTNHRGRIHVSVYDSWHVWGAHVRDISIVDSDATMCRIAPKKYTVTLDTSGISAGIAKERLAYMIAQREHISIAEAEARPTFTLPVNMLSNGELSFGLADLGVMLPQSAQGAR